MPHFHVANGLGEKVDGATGEETEKAEEGERDSYISPFLHSTLIGNRAFLVRLRLGLQSSSILRVTPF